MRSKIRRKFKRAVTATNTVGCLPVEMTPFSSAWTSTSISRSASGLAAGGKGAADWCMRRIGWLIGGEQQVRVCAFLDRRAGTPAPGDTPLPCRTHVSSIRFITAEMWAVLVAEPILSLAGLLTYLCE
jgi:hypothetical protein